MDQNARIYYLSEDYIFTGRPTSMCAIILVAREPITHQLRNPQLSHLWNSQSDSLLRLGCVFFKLI